uniref:FUN14 domain containing 1 n=1 Tax=Hucho hucho TaxID=62062 RepID=A0A4W5KN80_9TELE
MADREEDPENEDTYEVVDLTQYARRQQWWGCLFGGNNSGPMAEKHSVATQIALGGVSGWCAGYLFQKVGKIAATAVGGGFLLLQIANHSGYVQVDWKRVEKDVNKAKRHLKKKADRAVPELNSFIDQVAGQPNMSNISSYNILLHLLYSAHVTNTI